MISKLLIVALKPEWSHLKQNYKFIKNPQIECLYHIKNSENAALLQTGIGTEKAHNKFSEFLKTNSCDSVLHFGTSGGLVPEIEFGDLFVANEIKCEGETIPIDTNKISSLKHLPLKTGRLATVTLTLNNQAEKEKTATEHNAKATDMESFAIAKLCQEKNIPYLSVRGIFDAYNEDLETLGEPFDKQGNLMASKITANILKDPKKILKLPHLKKRHGLVNRHLAKVVDWYLTSSSFT